MFRKLLPFIVYLTSVFGLFAQKNSDMLTDYKWKYRIVLLFSSQEGCDWLRKEREILLSEKQGLLDRDLIIFEVTDSVKRYFIEREGGLNPRELRNHFSVGDDQNLFILIGKDGSEKLRSEEHVSTDKLFSLIDSMPMRKMEMKRDGN